MQKISRKLSVEEQILESVKQLFQVFTNKKLFIEWILQVLRAITLYFLKVKAGMEIDVYAETHDKLDMRTAPPAIRANIIYDEVILNERWSLCSGCEFLTESNTCLECGCFMAVAHKLRGKSCPLGKWNIYKPEKIHGITATS